MIVSHKMAQEAWDLLRAYTSIGSENIADAVGKPDAPEIVQHAFRQAAKVLHPDVGGEAAKFAEADRAKHVLLAWLERAAPEAAIKPHGGVTECPRCKGGGYLSLQKGIRQLRMQCPTCRGRGEIDDEKESTGDRLS